MGRIIDRVHDRERRAAANRWNDPITVAQRHAEWRHQLNVAEARGRAQAVQAEMVRRLQKAPILTDTPILTDMVPARRRAANLREKFWLDVRDLLVWIILSVVAILGLAFALGWGLYRLLH